MDFVRVLFITINAQRKFCRNYLKKKKCVHTVDNFSIRHTDITMLIMDIDNH